MINIKSDKMNVKWQYTGKAFTFSLLADWNCLLNYKQRGIVGRLKFEFYDATGYLLKRVFLETDYDSWFYVPQSKSYIFVCGLFENDILLEKLFAFRNPYYG